jgi:hypothetical protein
VGSIEDCIGPTTLLTSLSKGRVGSTEDGIRPTTSSTNGWLGEGSWEATGGCCWEITMSSNNLKLHPYEGKGKCGAFPCITNKES